MLYNYNLFNMLLYFCWRKKCQKNLKKLELLARTLLFQNCANIFDFIKKHHSCPKTVLKKNS